MHHRIVLVQPLSTDSFKSFAQIIKRNYTKWCRHANHGRVVQNAGIETRAESAFGFSACDSDIW